MNIQFERNAYFYARRANEEGDGSAFEKAKENMRCSNGNGDDFVFKQMYSSKGWMGRKVQVLPRILIAAVKAIYHLCLTILSGIPKLCSGNTNAFKARAYYLLHDLLEAFGWALTLLLDSQGQYFVQASQFNKTCFDLYLSRDKIDLGKASEAYHHLTLKEYREINVGFKTENLLRSLSAKNFKELLPHFSIYEYSSIPKEQIPNLDASKLTKQQVDQLFPAGWLFTKFSTELKFAALSSAQVESILNKLSYDQMKMVTPEQRAGSQRVREAYDEKMRENQGGFGGGFGGFDDFFFRGFPGFGGGFGGGARRAYPGNDGYVRVRPQANHYAALGLVQGASKADIKKAFFELAKKHHPDKGGDKVKFQEIEEAYRALYKDG